MYVKFNDLSRIHKPIIKSSMSSFKKVVENSQFVLNKDIQILKTSMQILQVKSMHLVVQTEQMLLR